MAWTEKEEAQLAEILKKYPAGRQLSAVLPALYLAQQDKNWLDHDDINAVADALDIPVTHVHSIIGFYTLFRKERTGKYMVQVCTDLPCALRGADGFYQRLVERMGLPPGGGTTADGLFTVEAVVCLAACDKAPMCQINLEYFESLTDDGIDDIIAGFREQAAKEQIAQ
jgi:NADH-quinone oxidoreductase subunit E